ncbi:hypothetical protein PGT21_017898 [Puccinia graminis f. sp. tritici]|uniref:Uncharacterized protein n=1 Tax=Puccinia graminis f. sp. tritici TaxID=56615 RepID=A0A5B0PL64_PUCGR|nr:hypothetical protein PGT21_017898 [Puccinia graminis f. sp. tritici]
MYAWPADKYVHKRAGTAEKGEKQSHGETRSGNNPSKQQHSFPWTRSNTSKDEYKGMVLAIVNSHRPGSRELASVGRTEPDEPLSFPSTYFRLQLAIWDGLDNTKTSSSCEKVGNPCKPPKAESVKLENPCVKWAALCSHSTILSRPSPIPLILPEVFGLDAAQITWLQLTPALARYQQACTAHAYQLRFMACAQSCRKDTPFAIIRQHPTRGG